MSEPTTTTTTEVPSTTTTTTEAPKTTTTTTTQVEQPKDDGKLASGSVAPAQPSREESLKAAGTASPASRDGGLKDGTKVLGADETSVEDQQHDVRREALGNAKGEQDLKA